MVNHIRTLIYQHVPQLGWRQWLWGAHVMWVRICALQGDEEGAEEHCTPPAWALQLALVQK